MTARASFWQRLLTALTHHGPGYELPTTGERYAHARIGFALAHCNRIEDQLRNQDTIPAADALDAIRCIRSALDPDGA